MTLGAFNRAGSKLLVTADTLTMEGILQLGSVFGALIRIMTGAAGLGIFIFTFRKGMMTVTAREPVSLW
jgi:hypothetical protein